MSTTTELRANAKSTFSTVEYTSNCELALEAADSVRSLSRHFQWGQHECADETLSLYAWGALWVVGYDGVNDAEWTVWENRSDAIAYTTALHAEMDAPVGGCWFGDDCCDRHVAADGEN